MNRAAVATEVLRTYLSALTAGDLDAIARSFAQDATWTLHGTLPLAGTRVGRDRIMDFLVGAGGLFQLGTQSFTFGEITVQDDRAVLEWRVQGVAAATGLTYDNSYCGVFVIRDREIAEVREYLDSLHAADTLYPRPQSIVLEDRARTEQTRATVHSFFKSLQAADATAMRNLLAPNATWWLSGSLPTSGTWTGPDQILDEFLTAMFARLDPQAPVKQELHQVLADGDHAIAEWTTTATTKHGLTYRNDYAAIFRVNAGVIVEVREYLDTDYAQQTMFSTQSATGTPSRAAPHAP